MKTEHQKQLLMNMSGVFIGLIATVGPGAASKTVFHKSAFGQTKVAPALLYS